MIEKFISIKNIGRYRDSSARGDVSFRKLTLLFAENGRGKTTLCGILRSLQTGLPEFITERKTLGAVGASTVQIRAGGNLTNFNGNAWTTLYPNISIFDSVFIHDNVYAGDSVDHEHKKNLYRVVVGEQGVQLARQVESLDGHIREANRDIAAKKDIVSRGMPNGITVDAYLAWQPIANIDVLIQQKNDAIVNLQRSLDRATEILQKGLLSSIALPEFPVDFTTILAKQLTDITADADVLVREHIATHRMGARGEAWLSAGVGFIANDDCPLCGQNINANALIAAYQSHFNDAYRSLKQEVAQLKQRVNTSIGDASLNATQQTLSNNATLVEFWKQFSADIVLPTLAIEEINAKYSALRNYATILATQKEQSPIESVMANEEFTLALVSVGELQESVRVYNEAVTRCNSIINDQKSTARQGGDVNLLRRELQDLEQNKMRFEPAVVLSCQEYREALTAKEAFDNQKEAAKVQLDQYCIQILQVYETAINRFLDQFNAGFRLANSRHRYTGGTPSSHYQIVINNNAVDLGDQRTPAGTPTFKTALSSGDKSALALAFFLAALEQDAALQYKIVVFDDPFASQDRFRRTCTQQLIRSLSGVARQVIVLSHDPFFLRSVWEGYNPADIKALQLRHCGTGTVINEWDIDAETQSDYLKNYSVLLGFYRERSGAFLDVVRSIRPLLEGMLRVHFPGQFQPTEWLGDFIAKVRASDDADGLSHAKADLPEIEAINDYSKKYHHDQNTNCGSEPTSEDELHGFVKRTLRLVGGVE